MRRFQRVRDLNRLADSFRCRDRTAWWLAMDVLEHEIARPDVVQLTDVRMVQRGDRPRFMFESAQPIRVIALRQPDHVAAAAARTERRRQRRWAAARMLPRAVVLDSGLRLLESARIRSTRIFTSPGLLIRPARTSIICSKSGAA